MKTESNLSASKLALLMKWRRGEGVTPTRSLGRRPTSEATKLSSAQQRIWFMEQVDPGLSRYNLWVRCRASQRVDAPRLQACLDALIRRHDALRTTIGTDEHGAVLVRNDGLRCEVVIADARVSDDAVARKDTLSRDAIHRAFDLRNGPLYRVHLYRDEQGDELLIVAHHIVSDGWSFGIILQELVELYAAQAEAREPRLAPLPIEYADFAHWQASRSEWGDDLPYWRQRLAGELPVLELPTDRPRPRRQTFRGALYPFELSLELSADLRSFSRGQGVSTYMTLLSVFFAFLFRHTGQQDLIVGSPAANRDDDTQGVVGVFVNMLALRVAVEPNLTLKGLLERVRVAVQEGMAHGRAPFERIVEAIRPKRDVARPPIFQVVFDMFHFKIPPSDESSLQLHPVAADGGSAQFDLTLFVDDSMSALKASFGYNPDLFDEATVARFAKSLSTILETILRAPDTPLWNAPVMRDDDLHRLVREWNATASPASSQKTVLDWIDDQVRNAKDRTAVIFGSESLAYGELDRIANRIAHWLQDRCIGADSVVGICMDRSPRMIAAILGILKAGAAYLPLDPESPMARITSMVEGAAVRVIVTEERHRLLMPGDRDLLSLDDDRALDGMPTRGIAISQDPQRLAYVIYTSGSTGSPKGAMNTHGGLANRLKWMQETFPLGPDDRVLQKTPNVFDVSVWELLWPLAAGATLVMAEPGIHRDPTALGACIRRHAITVLHFVPSMLHAFLEARELEQAQCVRRVFASGEALSHELVQRFFAQSKAELHNLYGPTEASIDVSWWPCERGATRQVVPIGRPIANTKLYVLDDRFQPVPVGIHGELFISGLGLARGYMGRADLTAERFLPDPWAGASGARMYKTGDRARYLPDGAIEFLGRIDHQIKLRGYRIELGEIETVLRRQAAVADAVVVAVEDDGLRGRLIAYWVPRDGRTVSDDALREAVREQLPEYMVPTVFMKLEALPLLATGKIDRRALPRVGPDRPPLAASFLAPRNPAEEWVARLWCDLLAVDRVGIDDDFFALGGHSLLGAQMIVRMREAWGADIPLRTLFDRPTIRTLCAELKSASDPGAPSGEPMIARRPPAGGSAPTSFAQQRLWFLQRFFPSETAYNEHVALRLLGELDIAGLEWSLTEVVRRHEVLRTTFCEQGGVAVQVVGEAEACRLEVEELSEEDVPGWMMREWGTAFDLVKGPLWRVRLGRLGEREHVLLVTMHHMVSDAWSQGLWVGEVVGGYQSYVGGERVSRGELGLQYADYAYWQREHLKGELLSEQVDYWRKRLEGAPSALELGTDRPRPVQQTFSGASYGFEVGAEQTSRLLELGAKHGSTLYMVLLSSFQVLLWRYSGQEEIVVGSPVANRPTRQTEELIGLFVNMVPMRSRVEARARFTELLGQVRSSTLDAYAHQDLPFEKLVEELNPERDMSRSPVFQVMFALQNTPSRKVALPGLEVELLETPTQASKFELSLFVEQESGRLRATFEYNTDLFERRTIERMAGHWRSLLERVVSEPGERIGRLARMSEEERSLVLGSWNRTESPYDREVRIEELIRAQSERTPDAVALVSDGQELTYRELESRSNRLASYLRKRGVCSEAKVGVSLERSSWMVVSMLGVWKAGGGYVPIAPSLPEHRRQKLARDAKLRWVISERSSPGVWPDEVEVLGLEQELGALERESDERLVGAGGSRAVAYVMYTSGSTGEPKGVVVEHRSVVNFFRGIDERLGTAPGVWLALTSLSFDISILELVWTLTRGYQVVIQREARKLSSSSGRPIGFSLFYFASDAVRSGAGYRMLLEGARFADEHGFEAVWTPERHFHAFGGLYPNPSVVSAAVAAVTRRVQIRAGSVVVPLHHPVRVAEEWSVVDNLSGGRVAIAFASGWHPNDFVLAPGEYANRRERMWESIATIQKLWRGESVTLPGGTGEPVQVRVMPRPVQAELGVWVTAAGSVETFVKAGEHGANVLTHLLGQTIEGLSEKIRAYRKARASHEGQGRVTLMLHTFVGEDEDEVKRQVEGPFRAYLKSSADLWKPMASAAGIDLSQVSEKVLEQILDNAVRRYFETSALFGSREKCLGLVEKLKEAGVDEVACLIDFGVEEESVLRSLPALSELQRASEPRDESIGGQIERHGVTHLQCTPSMAVALLSDERSRRALGHVKKLMLGGEALARGLLGEVQEVSEAEILNMYGPTETTIWSTTCSVRGEERIGIGRPIANTRTYILDEELSPVPWGVVGELYIGGEGLARGYWERPELTAERFVPDPFEGEGGRLYRTGDRARYLEDGTLEYVGRSDTQVKLHGYRIELGEVESSLLAEKEVSHAVAVVREDVAGDRRLVAYWVPKAPNGQALEEQLLSRLRERLPEYMIPSALVEMSSLPLTSNGKVDRKGLPAPSRASGQVRLVGPRNPREYKIAQILSELLGVREIGVHDSFFRLGGHSLLATRAVGRIGESFGVRVSLRSIFEKPTIAGLAEAVEAASADGARASRIERAAQNGPSPLSFAQQRLWVLDQLDPGQSIYNVPMAIELRGELDVPALERSLGHIVKRHEVLRGRVEQEGSEPVQWVEPVGPNELPIIDLSGLGERELEEELVRVVEEEAAAPFDLRRGPLFRVRLVKCASERHVLLGTMHHLVSDGWSRGLLVEELVALYEAYVAGREPTLPELPIQYGDYASWQRAWLTGEVLQDQLAYWTKHLAGAPPALELPPDRSRPRLQSFAGAMKTFELREGLVRGLEQVGKQYGATFYMTLLAAFKVLLYRFTGQTDLVVGTPIANRHRPEVEPLIGFFVNTLALRTSLDPKLPFYDLLARVRETAVGAYAHQDLPFERLVEELKPARDLSRSPIFQVMFVLQNAPMPPLHLHALEVKPVRARVTTSKFDLTLIVEPREGAMTASFEYSTALYDTATIDQLAAHFTRLLADIADHPETPVADLHLFGEEQKRLLSTWNDTRVDYPRPLCVHQLFEAQAAHTPDATAVIFGRETLTYRELNRRANQLAHLLIARGVEPEAFVGICLQRSVHLVVAILAVFKAGAAYVPIDPLTPHQRIQFLLSDAGAKLALVDSTTEGHLVGDGFEVIVLDRDEERMGNQPGDNLELEISKDRLAYVIYTSGSTGVPKGIAMRHEPLTNLISWQTRVGRFTARDRTPQLAPINFDISLQECFSTWAAGGWVVLVSEDVRRDPEALLRLIIANGITRLFLPFVMLQNIAEASHVHDLIPTTLSDVYAAGEQLHVTDSIERFFRKLPRCRLHNHYGPSEAHVVAAHQLDQRIDRWPALPSVGGPIDNTEIYILDERMKSAPIGAPGELYISGACLSRGYLGRPDLTAQQFVPNPFGTRAGDRLYRTGDRGRYLANGDIELFGRIDNQVKVRGFRVELGEVEAALRQQGAVRDAVVLLREDTPGDKRLVAYIVLNSESTSVSGAELRKQLKDRLPEYMIPSAFVVIERLPTTNAGKIERSKLPAPDVVREAGRAMVAPRTPTERALAELWSELLGAQEIGVDDNFFDLGGHSLLATRLSFRIRETFGVVLPLRAIFEEPTIAALDERIQNLRWLAESTEMAGAADEADREQGVL